MHKIQNMLEKTGKHLGRDLENTPIIIADIFSETSLKEMCQKAKVLINCVGPYDYYGDAVIKACITGKTDEVDICGESFFLEKSQLLYEKCARESGIYIVGGCGFDCIPAEMGVLYTEQQFKGELVSVDNFIRFHHQGAGITFHAASIESFLVDLVHMWDRRHVRSQLLSKSRHQPNRLAMFYQKSVSSWCLPLINADICSVERSQSYFHHKTKKRLPSEPTTLDTANQGPTREQINGTSFVMEMEGSGYSVMTDDGSHQQDLKVDKKIVTCVTGPDMGYVTTPICLVQAAVLLLKERDKLPPEGGVYPTGAAFCNTSLIHRLNAHNVKFSVLKTD